MNNTEALHQLTELATPRARPPRRKGPRRRQPTSQPQASELHLLEQSLEDLLAPTAVTEESTLTWEQREAEGIAELLRIYHDALLHPLSDAEFARSEHIVATLNEHRPPN